ncbi:hypothetical protein Ahy_B08g091859 [Arachis hypogaea]|uniref:SWIM-type domain-containing protein n=1 Tax=Arachis hypogaea TaxID=3818 RepID=A0A444Y2S1_ARAHY|nr:hypothetical protein Ahy_B08g091859 [Arachis hypogaea]
MLCIYQQTRFHVSMIELYVEFEQQSWLGAVGEEVNVDELRDINWEEDNNDSEEEFEANYEVDDENDDGDLAGNPAVQNETDVIVSQHLFSVPSFMRILDLEAMHAPEFPKYANMGYSRTEQEYNKNYQRLKERGEAYTKWCDDIDVERWMLAFDGDHRWGHMTTKLVECLNSVLKGTHNLPVTAIVRSTFYQLNELFTRKSVETHEHLRNGFTYLEFATKRVEESFRYAGNIVINRFDRQNEMFEVREIQDGSVYTVNFTQRHCDCGHFQAERLPCRHILACCTNQRLDWQVYVHDVYKMSKICNLYRGEFVLMGDQSTWHRYERAKVIANWTLRRVMKGRPKSTHYLNEMDSRDMRGPRRCTICGREGHSRSRCPQRAGPSTARGH